MTCKKWYLKVRIHISHRLLVEGMQLDQFYYTYINDLPACVNSVIKLFAGWVKLYRKIVNLDDCLALQKNLEGLQILSNDWQIVFNHRIGFYYLNANLLYMCIYQEVNLPIAENFNRLWSHK